jgi:ABC-type multidrug transport system fused ATPase/permease subunit
MSEAQGTLPPRRVARSIAVLLPLVADQKWHAGAMVGLGLVMALLEGLGLSLVILFVYVLLGGGRQAGDAAGALGPVFAGLLAVLHDDPTRIGIAAFAAVMGSALLGALYGILAARLANIVADRTRAAMFGQYLSVEYDYIKRKGRAALIDTIEFEASFVPTVIVSLAGIVGHIITILVYGALIAFISWQLALTLAVLGTLFLAASLLPGGWLGRIGAQVSRLNEALVAHTVGGIQAMRIIRLHGVETAFGTAFAKVSQQFARAQLRLAACEQMLAPLRALGSMMVLAGFLLEAWYLNAGAATVLGVAALAYRIAPTVGAVVNFITSTLGYAAPLGLVAGALARRDKFYPPPGTAPFDGNFRRLEFRSVTYTYWDGREPVLRDISFRLERGQMLALTGVSGSGKTTIVNLLARLCEPDHGRILLDGVPLSDVRRPDWFRHVAFAGQDLDLIDGSIAENVRFARPWIGDADIAKAMRIADIHAFVQSLPQGEDTKVGDYGHRLSGGQRQRIGLARALAGGPSILVLDESTNAIEVQSEASIFDALRTQLPDLTLIVITHRAALRSFDQVLRLEEGTIARSMGRTDCP